MPAKEQKTKNLKTKTRNSKVKKKVSVPKKTEVKTKVARAKTVKVEPRTAKKVYATLKLDVVDIKGKAAGTIEAPKEIFEGKINPSLMAQAVRVYLANQRQGTSSTKTRGEVAGSTRKIWRQKGTGRARHGSIRAPIFVKGGIAFGPKPRDFSLDFTKKMRRLALFSALSSKMKSKEIKIVSGFSKVDSKTKEMVAVLKHLNIVTRKGKVLFVLGENMESTKRAARNIADVELTPANLLNTYDVLNSGWILFADSAINLLQKTFLKA